MTNTLDLMPFLIDNFDDNESRWEGEVEIAGRVTLDRIMLEYEVLEALVMDFESIIKIINRAELNDIYLAFYHINEIKKHIWELLLSFLSSNNDLAIPNEKLELFVSFLSENLLVEESSPKIKQLFTRLDFSIYDPTETSWCWAAVSNIQLLMLFDTPSKRTWDTHDDIRALQYVQEENENWHVWYYIWDGNWNWYIFWWNQWNRFSLSPLTPEKFDRIVWWVKPEDVWKWLDLVKRKWDDGFENIPNLAIVSFSRNNEQR